MQLEESGMRGRVEHILAVPWGLHFDALEFGSGRMERKYFVGLLKRKLEIVSYKEKGVLTSGSIEKRKLS